MIPKPKESKGFYILRGLFALLLALGMLLPNQSGINTFADGETTPQIDFVYDLSGVNNPADGESKSFTVTANVKNASELTVLGVSLAYDQTSLKASVEGKDVATFSGETYQSGIWTSTNATSTGNASTDGKITYEAYVNPACETKEESEDSTYSITQSNGKNKLFNSTAAGYDFATFTFTLKDSSADANAIKEAIKSVKLNADSAQGASDGYYVDGIIYAKGQGSTEDTYNKGELSGVYIVTLHIDDSTTKTVHVAKGATLASAIDASYNPTKTGHTFKGWTKTQGKTTPDDGTTTTFEADTDLYPVWEANKYTVTEPQDANGKYTISGFSISGADYDSTAKKVTYCESGATIAFTLTLDEAYSASTPTVTINGLENGSMSVTNGSGNNYSCSYTGAINSALSFSIAGVDSKNTYAVTLPSVTGATLAVAEGYDASAVEYGSEFKFTLTLDAAYSKATPAVQVGEDTLTGSKDEGTGVYTYTIQNVTSDISNITVDALAKNKYTITLAGANDNIYFTTDNTYSSKKESEISKTEHGETYTFYVKYTDSDAYTGYKVKVGGEYLQVSDSDTFTADQTFTTSAITADTTITIEPQTSNSRTITVVYDKADGKKETLHTIAAEIGNKIKDKLGDGTYQAALQTFLSNYPWLANNVTYKLDNVDISDIDTIGNDNIEVKVSFARSKYVITYQGATLKEGQSATQDVLVADVEKATPLARTAINPDAKIADNKMFAGWTIAEDGDVTKESIESKLKAIDNVFEAGLTLTAKWTTLGAFVDRTGNNNPVGLADLNVFLENYGKAEDTIYDMNCDGKVNALDLALLLKNYGADVTV